MLSEIVCGFLGILFLLVHSYTMRRDREMWRNLSRPCNVLSIRIPCRKGDRP